MCSKQANFFGEKDNLLFSRSYRLYGDEEDSARLFLRRDREELRVLFHRLLKVGKNLIKYRSQIRKAMLNAWYQMCLVAASV